MRVFRLLPVFLLGILLAIGIHLCQPDAKAATSVDALAFGAPPSIQYASTITPTITPTATLTPTATITPTIT
ncbi:MAG TPA: hypothetical protein ENG33_05530, partial [Chloroflexi bacterium]|nr:hypothetical protein [Chloroflexota bacterium]